MTSHGIALPTNAAVVNDEVEVARKLLHRRIGTSVYLCSHGRKVHGKTDAVVVVGHLMMNENMM
jgi:hypothetical protein